MDNLKNEQTSFLMYPRFPANQVSGPIALAKGRVYFMQAFVKEGGGGDHISVGVKLPDQKTERPIQNVNLFVGPNGKVVKTSTSAGDVPLKSYYNHPH